MASNCQGRAVTTISRGEIIVDQENGKARQGYDRFVITLIPLPSPQSLPTP